MLSFILFSLCATTLFGYNNVVDIPNPMLKPELCGREGVLKSAVCDLNLLLSNKSKNVIDGVINKINEINTTEYGVLIIDKMNKYDVTSKEIELYARNVHDSWGIDGILIFISIKDRGIYISHSSKFDVILKANILDNIIENMKPSLREKNYEHAITIAIVRTNNVIHNIQNNTIDINKDEKNAETILLFVILLLSFGSFFGIYYNNKYKIEQLNKGLSAQHHLVRDVKNMNKENYMSETCPCCLENFELTFSDEFTGAQVLTDINAFHNVPNNRPFAMRCKHIMCYKCLKDHIRISNKSAKCPMCRALISEDTIITEMPSRSNIITTRPRLNYSLKSNRLNEILYRIERAKYKYPSVITSQLSSQMRVAVTDNNITVFSNLVIKNEGDVKKNIALLSEREHMAKSGKSGSKSSWSGGRSSGGRGGRW
jgi:uncharacterized membrane protein YgcG